MSIHSGNREASTGQGRSLQQERTAHVSDTLARPSRGWGANLKVLSGFQSAQTGRLWSSANHDGGKVQMLSSLMFMLQIQYKKVHAAERPETTRERDR